MALNWNTPKMPAIEANSLIITEEVNMAFWNHNGATILPVRMRGGVFRGGSDCAIAIANIWMASVAIIL